MDDELGSRETLLTELRALRQEVARLRARENEMIALHAISLEMNAEQDMQALLQAIVRQAAAVVGTSTGGLYTVDHETKHLELVVMHNPGGHFVGIKLQFGEGLSGRVAQTGELMAVEDYSVWANRSAVFHGTPFRRVLAVPLKPGNEVIGVLNLSDLSVAGPFSEDEIRIARLFADQAALALGNARRQEGILRELAIREQAATALRNREETIQALMNANPSAALLIDTNGAILIHNARTTQWLGWDESTLVGQCIFNILPPEVSGRYRAAADESAQLGRLIRFEVAVRGRTFDNCIHPVFAQWGQVDRLAIFVTDISEHKAMEEALLESERRYRQALENSPSPIFTVDGKRRIRTWNGACERIFQYGQDIIGRDYRGVLFEAEHSPLIDQILAEVIDGRALGDTEIAFRCRDGTKRFAVSRIYPLYDPFGKVQEVVFANTDITERKLIEDALQASESRMTAIINSAKDSIFVKNTNMVYVQANRAMADLFGLSPDEIVGKTDTDLFGGEVAARIIEIDRCVLAGGTVVDESPITLKGKERTLSTIKVPLRDGDGNLIGICGITRDITDRVQAEHAVQTALREKECLLKEVHHRVKNNLQIVNSLLFLQSEHIDDPKILEMFRESQSRVRSMALIHERLYQSENLGEIDFAQYIRDLTKRLSGAYRIGRTPIMMNVRAADIYLDISTAVPCGLLINELVSNALKYAFPSGDDLPSPRIDVEMRNENDEIVILVSDNGIGFPEGVDWHHSKTLGLQLVSLLTRQLEGTVEMEVNHGTTFRITFPAKPVRQTLLPATAD